MVGRLARMRVSSVMRTFLPRISVGTLKSTRTRTRLPRTSRSRRVSFGILLLFLLVIVIVLGEMCCFVFPQHVSPLRKLAKQSNGHLHNSITKPLFSQHLQQFDAAIAVAPFIVIPTDDLHKAVAKHKRQPAVKNAGMRISHDILGNERLVTV